MSEKEPKDHAILKIFYVFLFYIIYGVSDLFILFIAVVQTILNLFGGGPSQTLRQFGASLGIYVKQIADYVSYASEEKPFPFSDWPEPKLKSDQQY